ncbi:hypothetical protein BD779DRAFT_1528574 [Infundibulicybe gibba]|nr:hypothetical protein BD779DRAFT_1528574 [Infundibulicybe gibba]
MHMHGRWKQVYIGERNSDLVRVADREKAALHPRCILYAASPPRYADMYALARYSIRHLGRSAASHCPKIQSRGHLRIQQLYQLTVSNQPRAPLPLATHITDSLFKCHHDTHTFLDTASVFVKNPFPSLLYFAQCAARSPGVISRFFIASEAAHSP